MLYFFLLFICLSGMIFEFVCVLLMCNQGKVINPGLHCTYFFSSCKYFPMHREITMLLPSIVLFFCVESWELSLLTQNLSQAEKKITFLKSWAAHKMTTTFTQNDNLDHFEWNKCHFEHFAQLVTTFIFLSAWDKSCVNWPTPEIRQRK